MKTSFPRRLALALAVALAAAGPARAQFLDPFDGPSIPVDPEGLEGWSFFTGDGDATIDLRAGGRGQAHLAVDATPYRAGRRRCWGTSTPV